MLSHGRIIVIQGQDTIINAYLLNLKNASILFVGCPSCAYKKLKKHLHITNKLAGHKNATFVS